MQDYYQPTEYTLEQLWFDYLDVRYTGRGFMKWNPQEGFQIEAVLDPDNQLPRDILEFGKIGIIGNNSKSSIKMKLQGFDWAIAPDITLFERKDIIYHNRLSIRSPRVIFCQSEYSKLGNYPSYLSYGLYETKREIELSDTVQRTEKINDKVFKRSLSSGIDYRDEQQKVVGSKIDNTHIEISWTHPKTDWSKYQSWHWAVAAQNAFSIWYGETVQLLKREIDIGSKRYLEIRQKKELHSLGVILSPLGFNRKLEQEVFINLARHFTFNPEEAFICRQIFNQILEASRQKNWQTRELLIATILEAALRTYEKKPFAKDLHNKAWRLDAALKRFREQYWSRDWKKIQDKVLETHRQLRNRNAHPDWLFEQTGYLSDEQKEQSLDEMMFLCRFYGYMILALAGAKNLKPHFPTSHKEWQPLYLVMREEEASKYPIFDLVDQVADHLNNLNQKS